MYVVTNSVAHNGLILLSNQSANTDHIYATTSISFRFVASVFIALTLLAFDYRGMMFLEGFKNLISVINYPYQLIAKVPSQTIEKTQLFFKSRNDLTQENQQLKKDLGKAQVELHGLNAVSSENNRLRALLATPPRQGYRFTMAKILSLNTGQFRHTAILDKGSVDGVYVKQVVLAEGGGVYGQIVNVAPYTSTVIQIIDRRHAMPVRNTRTNARAIVRGTGNGDYGLEVRSIKPLEDFRSGDHFVSSGLNDIYPVDFPVAYLDFKQRLDRTNNTTLFPAHPSAAINTAQEVLLVWREAKLDINSRPLLNLSTESFNTDQPLQPSLLGSER